MHIEEFLDKNKTIYKNIYDDYEKFNFLSREAFIIDLNFLLKNIYTDNIFVENSKVRLSQTEFREQLINKYKNCIISNNDCLDELEACHIIEVKNNGDYNINNGLLLSRNLHVTFDKNLWCINPDTLYIEVAPAHNKGSINKYINTKINLDMNDELYNNLLEKYNNYKGKNM